MELWSEHAGVIDSFSGEYEWLSNMYEAPMMFRGLNFTCSEAAYQAMKTRYPEEREMFVGVNGYRAKRLGNKDSLHLRDDWELIKYEMMRQVLWGKFMQNPDLAKKLVATGDVKLVEGNHWNDTYWGVCKGMGQNKLGELLMITRRHLMREGIF